MAQDKIIEEKLDRIRRAYFDSVRRQNRPKGELVKAIPVISLNYSYEFGKEAKQLKAKLRAHRKYLRSIGLSGRARNLYLSHTDTVHRRTDSRFFGLTIRS